MLYRAEIEELAEIVRVNGGRAMFVGGCVRDELMGIEPKDWDLEVYGIGPERLKGLLEEFVSKRSDAFGKAPLKAVGEAFAV